MTRKSILATNRVSMPDGSRPSLREFFDWVKSFDHDAPPQHGSIVPCIAALVLSDCFPCTGGPITGGSPGPVCGWTFSQAFGALGGQVDFQGGQMLLQTLVANQLPGATKQALNPTILTRVVKFTFTEFTTGPSGAFYENFLVSSSTTQAAYLRLNDDGTLTLQVGNKVGANIFSGTWAPGPGGASRTVFYRVPTFNAPELWIDGIQIPLLLTGFGVIPIGTLPQNTVSFFTTSGASAPDTAAFDNVFVSRGSINFDVNFCCP